jgi:hypothetical protein
VPDRGTTSNWPNDALSLPASVPSLPWLKHSGRLRWIIRGAQPSYADANQLSLDKVAIEQVGPNDLRLVDHKVRKPALDLSDIVRRTCTVIADAS